MPAFTMRSFAEEFRSGTIESLATLPITDAEIVIGKFLGTMGMVAALLALMLIYPLLLLVIGFPDPGQMIGSYLAILGLSSFFGAIGLWASSMTRNQVVSFIIGFFVCFIFFILGQVADLLPGLLAPFIRPFGIQTHYEALSRGILDTRDILYWVSGTVFFLSACLASVHARRWR
jgi:ABC-2 type transport system permease protein